MEDRERRSVGNAEEATDESSTEDVELHKRRLAANADEPSEGQSDDDVELHKKPNPA